MILEDDVEIKPECVPVLEALGRNDDWDMVKLFHFHNGMPVKMGSLGARHNLVVHLTRTSSAAAYLVNRRAAKILLGTLLPMKEPLDHAHDRPWETGLRVRGVRPMPVGLAPCSASSSIGYADRGSLTPGRALRLLCSRAGKEIRRCGYGLAESFLR